MNYFITKSDLDLYSSITLNSKVIPLSTHISITSLKSGSRSIWLRNLVPIMQACQELFPNFSQIIAQDFHKSDFAYLPTSTKEKETS